MGLITPTQALFGAGGVRPPAVLAAMAQAGAAIQGIVNQGVADPFTSDAGQVMGEKVDSVLLGGTITWDLSDKVQIKSITGFKEYSNSSNYDFEGTRFHLLDIGVGGNPGTAQTALGVSNNFPIPRNVPDQEDRFFSQEFNISGVAFDNRLNWLAGIYYSSEDGREYGTSAGLPIIAGTVSINDADVGEKSYSIYTQDDFKLTDKLSLTVGGRYTKEVHSITWRDNTFRPVSGTISCKTTAYTPAKFTPTTPAGTTDSNFCAESREDSFSGTSWLGSLNYQLQDDILVYLKVSRGFRGGAEQQSTPGAPPVKPEFAQEYEVGLKGDWFDHRLRTNIALYRTKYENKQETAFLPPLVAGGSVITLLNNAGQATLQGAEFEATVNPFQGFTIRGQTAYFTGTYDDYLNPVAHLSTTIPPKNAAGEKFSYPAWSGSISGRYEFPLLSGMFGAQVDYSYTGRTHTSARLANDRLPASILDQLLPGKSGASFINGNAELQLVNLHFDYAMPSHGLTLSADVSNALDKTYRVYSIHGDFSGGVVNSFVYPPRMWTVTITKKFGSES
jgi:iron complex outermembrane receptor protein